MKKKKINYKLWGKLSKIKKIPLKYYLVVLIVLILAIGSRQWWKFKHKNVAVPNNAAGELLDQYKKQLPQLKTKAESNVSGDLQNYGIAQYATGDLTGAEQTYRKQIEVDSNNSVAHNNLANTLRDEQKYDQAIEEYNKAVQLSPRSLNSYVNLGSVYQYSKGDMDKAVEIYKAGIAAIPDSVDLNLLIALAYEQKKDVANAKNYYQQVLKLDSNNLAAKDGLNRLK